MAESAAPLDFCNLAEAPLAERLAWIRRELMPHVTARSERAGVLRLTLDAGPGVRQKAEGWIALERECCSGIDFALADAATAGSLSLTIRGLPAEVAGRFGREGEPEPGPERAGTAAPPPRTPLARLARAVGGGAVLAGLVCCVLPIGVAALFGAAAASRIAWLDSPPVIAAAGLAFGLAWWRIAVRSTPAPDAGVRAAEDACGDRC